MKAPKIAPLVIGVAAALLLASCSASDSPQTSTADAMMTQGTPPDASAMPGDAMDATEDAMDSDDAMKDVVVDDKLKFTVSTLAGEAFDGTSLAGRDSILWFWASWCPTCQAEAPGVAEAAAGLPDGVTLYGVPGKSDQGGMDEFVDAYGLEDLTQIVDPDGGLWSAFGVASQPAFVLINDDGTITTIQGGLGKQGILDAAAELAAS